MRLFFQVSKKYSPDLGYERGIAENEVYILADLEYMELEVYTRR